MNYGQFFHIIEMVPDKVKFKSHVDLGESLRKQIYSDSVYLDDGKWKSLQMADVCLFIHEWDIPDLRVHENQNEQIIKQISQINFPSLKRLTLSNNNICSIEGFHRIWMPSLQRLYLSYNCILSADDIKKVYSPLICILLVQNVIQESQNLFKICSKSVEEVGIEWIESDPHQIFDLTWLLKVDGDRMKMIDINSRKRMKDKRIEEQLKRRFSSVDVLAKLF